jgi:8-oxo-dGTP diphosphatase
MRSRGTSGAGHPASRIACAVDVVLLTAERGGLFTLLQRRERWRLPGARWHAERDLDHTAAGLVRAILGRAPVWGEQVGAACTGAHPDGCDLSITYVVIVPRGVSAPDGTAWHNAGRLPSAVTPRQKAAVTSAVLHLRNRMDQVPIAFRLLPAAFTLTDLQHVYELLLGRSLHKASFRRALQAASLVEPTDQWRSEGRGRPAQFFRFAPRRRRESRRLVRFEMLQG